MARVGKPNLSKLSHPKFVAASGAMCEALSTDPLFSGDWPDIYPSLQEVLSARDNYVKTYNAALNRDILQISQRNKARAVLEQIFAKVFKYVESVAGDDPYLHLNIGYQLSGQAANSGKIDTTKAAPTNFSMNNGKLPGVATGHCSRMPYPAVYELQYAFADVDLTVEANWNLGGIFRLCSKMVVANLESVKRYAFRVRAIGDDGPGPWCAVVLWSP